MTRLPGLPSPSRNAGCFRFARSFFNPSPCRQKHELLWLCASRRFSCPSCSLLESKDLVLEFAHGPGLLETDGLGGLLETADHWGRAAEQDLDIVGGLGKPFLRVDISTSEMQHVAGWHRGGSQ